MSEIAYPAVRAFDAVAPVFDARFGEWLSVAAQRATIRRALLRAFPPGAHVLELGGGTGEDAIHLAESGREILMTDGSPTMVAIAQDKARNAGVSQRLRARVAPLEELDRLAQEENRLFDGAFSNFAAINCVRDLHPLSNSLSKLLRVGSSLIMVVFGPCSIGEIAVQLLKRDTAAAFRRFRRGAVQARIGGNEFDVFYHRPSEITRAFSPHFRLVRMRGVGIFVPPSAAEPWISRHPGLLRAFETVDQIIAAPFAVLGDHVLMTFERTP